MDTFDSQTNAGTPETSRSPIPLYIDTDFSQYEYEPSGTNNAMTPFSGSPTITGDNYPVDPSLSFAMSSQRLQSYLNEPRRPFLQPELLHSPERTMPSLGRLSPQVNPRWDLPSTIDVSSQNPSTPGDLVAHSPYIVPLDPHDQDSVLDHPPALVMDSINSSPSPWSSLSASSPSLAFTSGFNDGHLPVFPINNGLPQTSHPGPAASSDPSGRLLICPFRFAGCPSSHSGKNEWKRHTDTIHLQLSYYTCPHPKCRSLQIFNRKDLFTQHYKRMHFPKKIQMIPKKQPLPPEWEEKLRQAQDQAVQERCEPPLYLLCPVRGCGKEFRGREAFDERMEHLSKHYEAVAAGKEDRFTVGGSSDSTLTGWAEQVGTIRRTEAGWELCDPLEPYQARPRRPNRQRRRQKQRAASSGHARQSTDALTGQTTACEDDDLRLLDNGFSQYAHLSGF